MPVGLTDFVNVPLPEPLKTSPLVKAKFQAPVAVTLTVILMFTFPSWHKFTGGLVTTAVGRGATDKGTFCENAFSQFVAVLIIFVICKVCPLLAEVRSSVVKLLPPEPLATTVTSGCAAPAMV